MTVPYNFRKQGRCLQICDHAGNVYLYPVASPYDRYYCRKCFHPLAVHEPRLRPDKGWCCAQGCLCDYQLTPEERQQRLDDLELTQQMEELDEFLEERDI